MKKTMLIISILSIFFILSTTFVLGYETVKATKITANPDTYNGKNVLVYAKFGSITDEDRSAGIGVFEDFNIKGINYQYDLNNGELVKKIKKLKQRDMISIKGKVGINGFDPVIEIHDIVTGWVDTNLLPPTPDEITIVCPHCGSTFKYKITKNDYKKSVLDARIKDITPVVEQKNIQNNNEDAPNVLSNMVKEEKERSILDSTKFGTENNQQLSPRSQEQKQPRAETPPQKDEKPNEWSF